MSTRDRTSAPAYSNRYAEFREGSESWTFEIREYQNDLSSIVPADTPPDPGPGEAYRAAVFLEGFIQGRKSTGNWSDNALDRFDSFESTIEVEAVAKALRDLGESTSQ